MRLLIALMLATSAVALLPTADAHTCQGGYDACGNCVKGENHAHQDSNGQCASGPGYLTTQGRWGQSAEVPAGGLVGSVLALAVGALVAGRRA